MFLLPPSGRGPVRRVAVRRESDPLVVGRPSWTKIAPDAFGQPPGLMRSGFHDPKIRMTTLAAGDKHYFATVGRERSLIVVGRIVREPLDPSSVGLHAVQIRRPVPLGSKYDPVTVGRIGRVVIQAPRLL